ncbi:MAG TPA: ATP-dependent metallopeptidase FtsH/Yme1/Tma family protein [Labilithrix sp.]|nr:ATP-dependent metallopeptidase FtsH/Yme1/Tma family protein [Labilithrix sp.]
MMPIAPPPQPRQKSPIWILIPIGAAICAIVSFLAIWQFLTPGERRVPVAYSEFLAEVHAGHVDEIRIHDREVTFRIHDSSGRVVTKETIGPIPDQALVASLKPDDPSLPLPKVYFEK